MNTVGTEQDLNQLGIVLREGIELTLYSFELEADGMATHSTEEGLWVAEFNWDNVRELPGNQLP